MRCGIVRILYSCRKTSRQIENIPAVNGLFGAGVSSGSSKLKLTQHFTLFKHLFWAYTRAR